MYYILMKFLIPINFNLTLCIILFILSIDNTMARFLLLEGFREETFLWMHTHYFTVTLGPFSCECEE